VSAPPADAPAAADPSRPGREDEAHPHRRRRSASPSPPPPVVPTDVPEDSPGRIVYVAPVSGEQDAELVGLEDVVVPTFVDGWAPVADPSPPAGSGAWLAVAVVGAVLIVVFIVGILATS